MHTTMQCDNLNINVMHGKKNLLGRNFEFPLKI
jgi:hypothetical protein